jgi:hypothetical protein
MSSTCQSVSAALGVAAPTAVASAMGRHDELASIERQVRHVASAFCVASSSALNQLT